MCIFKCKTLYICLIINKTALYMYILYMYISMLHWISQVSSPVILHFPQVQATPPFRLMQAYVPEEIQHSPVGNKALQSKAYTVHPET